MSGPDEWYENNDTYIVREMNFLIASPFKTTLKARPNMDTAPLMQRIVLLHIMNETPQEPCENKLQLFSACSDESSESLLDIHHEKELVEALAFLASTTNDPRKVIAVCVEECKRDRGLVVRIAANHGGLVTAQRGLQGLANIVERVV